MGKGIGEAGPASLRPSRVHWTGCMKTAWMPKVGIGLAGAGLVVGLLSLLPAFGHMPTPLLLIGMGSMLYIPGAFLVFFFEKKERMKSTMGGVLRVMRILYSLVVIFWIIRIFNSGPPPRPVQTPASGLSPQSSAPAPGP